MEDLRDAEVQEGSSATFRCRISPGDYGPVHWFLDKTPLHTNELHEIEAQSGGYHVLTLRQLGLKDSGTVYFEAGDQWSSAALRVTGGLHAQCCGGDQSMWLKVQCDPGAHRKGAVGWALDPRVGLGGWVWLFQDESLHMACRADSMVDVA